MINTDELNSNKKNPNSKLEILDTFVKVLNFDKGFFYAQTKSLRGTKQPHEVFP